MTQQPARRARPAKPEEPARLAPAFDRDALTLGHLHKEGYLSRDELRRNLRRLGLELQDEEARWLSVPKLVHAAPQEPEPEEDWDEDDDEPEENDG